MPSWNIHLEAGERLADKLQLKGDARREFMFGCLVPDINNGYVNHPCELREHAETHYAYDQKSSLNFYAENRAAVDDKIPIYLGYIFHLFTDGFFNYDFFHRVKSVPELAERSYDGKNEVKHHDFWLYDTKFHHELDIPEAEYEKFAEKASALPRVDVKGADVAELVQIMHDDKLNDHVEGDKYWFYTEAELDALMERMIEGFSEQYLGEEYA